MKELYGIKVSIAINDEIDINFRPLTQLDFIFNLRQTDLDYRYFLLCTFVGNYLKSSATSCTNISCSRQIKTNRPLEP